MTHPLTLLLNLLFPLKCPLCGALTEGGTARLCPDCAAVIEEELTLPCPLCGETAPACTCRTDSDFPAFTEIAGRRHACIGFYRPGKPDSALSRMIYTLKRSTDDTAARICADLVSQALLRHFLAAGEDITRWTFSYPPRTRIARQKTGLDQAQRLARFCARRTGAGYAELFIRRGGQEQKALDEDGRRANAEASLRLKHPGKAVPERVILIDDIVTTGATLQTCAEILRNAGTESLFCASVLKTVPQRHRERKDGKPWFAE